MPQETFAALGERGVGRSARCARHRHPFQIQTRAIPPAPRRHGPAREVPHRVGQDARVRRAARPADAARRRAAGRTRPRPDARARRSGDRGDRVARRARALSVAAVYGGVPIRPQANAARDAHVVVATPGRLQDLVDRRLLALDAVEILVLDEADRMLDMGFKPQVDRIVKRLPRDRQTMFFSATLDGEVGELARAYTQSPAGSRPSCRPSTHPARSTTTSCRSRPTRRSTPWSSCSRPSAGSRSCSSAQSAAPTGSPASSSSAASSASMTSARAASAGARAVRERSRDDAHRDRRRRPRARPRRRDPRHQLRSARGREVVHAPRRPHRACGPLGHGRHARAARPAGGHEPRRAPERAPRDVREHRDEEAAPKLVYTSRRRGGWGSTRQRRR